MEIFERSILLRRILHPGGASHQFFIATDLIPIDLMYVEHSKTLAIFFLQVLVMHLVSPANGANIGIIAAGKPFETLMDNNVVNHKIGKAVSHYPKPDRLHPPYLIVSAKADQQHAGNGKYDKEGIVFFKEARLYLVMVFMQIP